MKKKLGALTAAMVDKALPISPRIPELDALISVLPYDPYSDPLTISAIRSMRVGGTD